MTRRDWIQLAAAVALLSLPAVDAHAQQVGMFSGHADIGTLLHPGNTVFDATKGSYTVSGSGDNMWFGADDFQFAWKKVSGDVAITADINFVGSKGNNHRKAALLLRQTLEPNSVYVDVARHGDGLTSLQYRDAPGADTHEVETAVQAPERVRIERRGDFAYVFVGDRAGSLRFSGAAMRVALAGDFYVGLGVCSHDKDVTESAIFTHVTIEPLRVATAPRVLWSTLETVKIASTDRLVAYTAPEHIEAPNWMHDARALLINGAGRIERFTLGTKTVPEPIATGPETAVNNDHGLSPDGSMLAFSDQTGDVSKIYVVSSSGGTPRLVTPAGPSYWHGWSPDGKTLAFTGQRAGVFGIFTVPAAGGPETRLTTAKGLDDGPEYTPDGAYLYFNSDRTGTMQIWRMRPDGTGPEQVIEEASNDWFPHPSPDGKWLVYLAYKPGVQGHPADQEVELRLMSLPDKKVKVLAKLFGGQGTLNVPSWSPSSDRVAFVSYASLP